MELVFMLAGAFSFAAGYATCYFFGRRRTLRTADELFVNVPRRKPSLRSPMRTYAVQYERYKARDTGLYQPVKPKRGMG